MKADGVYFRRRLFFAPPVAFFLVERLALFLVERFAFFLVDPFAFFLVERFTFFLVERFAFFFVDRLAFFRLAVFFVAIFMAPSSRHPLDLGCYGLPLGTSKGKTPENIVAEIFARPVVARTRTGGGLPRAKRENINNTPASAPAYHLFRSCRGVRSARRFPTSAALGNAQS